MPGMFPICAKTGEIEQYKIDLNVVFLIKLFPHLVCENKHGYDLRYFRAEKYKFYERRYMGIQREESIFKRTKT